MEDSLEEEVCEEIDRLYKCLDRDDDKKRKKSSSGSSSASSSSSSKKKKQSKKPKGKKEKEKEKGKKEKKEKNEPKKKKNKGGKPEVPKVGFSLLCLVFDCKVEETEQEKADRAALAEATKQAQKASLCPNLVTWVLVTQAVKDASNKLKWATGLLPKLSALPWPHSWLGVRLIPTRGDKHAESVKIDVEEKKQALEAIVNGYVS